MPIKLIAASPFEGFEKRWSKEWQQQYNEIILRADLVKYISSNYFPSCFQVRNEWMVDHSARVIAAFNGQKSGTKNTVDYARKKGIPVINII